MKTKNSTKRQQSCRLVEFLVFNSAFGRHSHKLIAIAWSSSSIIISKKDACRSKGTVFYFFRGKVCAHSLTQIWEHLYFFFQKEGKKNTVVFFFSQEKFTFHSLNFSGGAYIKKREKAIFFQNCHFNPILSCIFFPEICIFFPCIFFFPGKV